ncbi:MAG: penicillin-binding protein [Deltaproteobacteria bacterium]|nr:penicillin-binding protein [Deltaproteobacteria bacterium]
MRNLEPRRARWMKVRLGMLVTGIGVGFLTLAARAHELQIRQAPHLRELAQQQYDREVHQAPRRGTIFDRNHTALAVTVDGASLQANPRALRRHAVDVVALGTRLAGVLALEPRQVVEDMRRDLGFRWIKRNLSPDEASAVRAIMREYTLRADDGLSLVNEPHRWYPNRELAAHVIGAVDIDGHGIEGIEYTLNERLRGSSAQLRGVRDAMGRLVFAEGLTPGEGSAGHDVTLTIDKTIQFIAERELGEMVRASEAVGGSVIVTDPRTGEVLAMASYPTFDPNFVGRSAPEDRRNRAVAERYEPGSTMKIFTIAGALDSNTIQAGQLINTYGGTFTIADRTIHDTHPDNWMTPMQVLARSSNIGAAQVGLALGADGLERVFRRFGFGERTGLPLASEARARFGERRWYEVEVATVAFGQGIGVTTIQLAQALGAVANGGLLLRPLLVSRIHDATGALVEENVPDGGRAVIDPRVARLMGEMLTTVTEEGGTGVSAAINGVRVAGKTGTAQKARRNGRGYDDSRFVSSFIGFAPAQRPEVVVTVVIDEPSGHDHSGGAVAAPVFQRVTEETLRYLGRLRRSGATRASAGDALPPAMRPLVPTPIRRESPVNSLANRGAPVAVPALVGMTARRALVTASALGLQVELRGAGTVVRQEPSATETLLPGQTVTLVLEPGSGAPAIQTSPSVESASGERSP